MTKTARHGCPACGFTVFNRRVARCESCGAALPAGLLFSPEQISSIDAEHERNEKTRQTFKRGAGSSGGSGGGDMSLDFDWDGGD